MLNKIVCPKCGQLYASGEAKCPLCGQPTQAQPQPEAPVQRKRMTEVERRAHQRKLRQEAADKRRTEREARRAADAEEERRLEEEEEKERLEKKRRRLKRRGFTDAEIDRLFKTDSERVAGNAERTRIPRGLLVATVLVLLLSIAVGTTYLVMKLNGAFDTGSAASGTHLTLSAQTLRFSAPGETAALEYSIAPADSVQTVTFESSDKTVASVGELGVVTAVGEGSAVITVRCGETSATCTVECSFTAESEQDTALVLPDGLQLSKTDITFFNPKESIYLHAENLPNGVEIVWSSSDESVATVESNGHVVAVGAGTCNITATAGQYSASCIVRCNFKES